MNAEARDPVDVLVVGAGPTGLTLACDLRRRGVTCRIVERASTFHHRSRGKGIQPRTLEVFDDLGLAQQALVAGWSRHVRLKWHVGGRLLTELDIAGQDPRPDTPFPNLVLLPQWRTEELLRGRLTQFGGTVELGWELTALRQDAQAVTATVRSADGRSRTIRARYVVGCDGAHSSVADALGLRMDGHTHDEHFVFGDVEIEGLPADTAHVWFDAGRYLAASPFPGQRAWQVQASVHPDAAGRLEPASLELFQRLFTERTGRPDIRLSNPTWLSNFVSNVRMVDRYRSGRVFLAGDAAHVHSPAGGQGMNMGIQDAYNLGWKLGLVVLGRAGDHLLDTYEEERLPIARAVLQGTDVGYDIVFSANPVITVLRERILVPLLRLPLIQRAVIGAGDQLDLSYRDSQLADYFCGSPGLGRRRRRRTPLLRGRRGLARGPRAGDRAPDALLLDPVTHAPTRLFDRLRGPQFTLLLFTGAAPSAAGRLRLHALAQRLEQRHGHDLRVHVLQHPRGGRKTPGVDTGLLDPAGRAHRTYGATGGAHVLVRPDGYLAHRGKLGDTAALEGGLEKLLGAPASGRRPHPSTASFVTSPTNVGVHSPAAASDSTAELRALGALPGSTALPTAGS